MNILKFLKEFNLTVKVDIEYQDLDVFFDGIKVGYFEKAICKDVTTIDLILWNSELYNRIKKIYKDRFNLWLYSNEQSQYPIQVPNGIIIFSMN